MLNLYVSFSTTLVKLVLGPTEVVETTEASAPKGEGPEDATRRGEILRTVEVRKLTRTWGRVESSDWCKLPVCATG